MNTTEFAARDRQRILHGLKAIADHLGIRERQAKHWHGQGLIPTFPMGSTICARVGEIDDAIADQVKRAAEAKAEEAKEEAQKSADQKAAADREARQMLRPRRP